MDDTQKQLVLDYQKMFATDEGRRVYDDLATRLNYRTRIIPMGAPDATAFELGKREAFLYILDKIEADLNEQVQEVAEMEESNAGG